MAELTARRAGRMTGLFAAALALAVAEGALAGDVISTGPRSASVTVYRDEAIPDPASATWGGQGLAMISETREVDLPAGTSRLMLEGVADGAIPETAALEGLPGHIKEQTFDYDLLSPGSLIEHSLGRPVQLVRINPKTGKQTLEDAVLRSGPNGVVVDVGGHVEALGCGGEIQGLLFQGVPSELTGKAALSTSVTVDRPGRYQITLAYLTVGLAWKAAYVARLTPGADTLDLTGWVTLANHGGTSFVNAPTSVVAGRLERQAVRRVEAVLAQRVQACWPQGNSHHPIGEVLYHPPPIQIVPAAITVFTSARRDLIVTAQRREESLQKVPVAATQSDLGDYKLYTLANPTTVAARGTKQVAFLSQDGVKFEKVYVYKVTPDALGGTEAGPTTATLRLENKPENGLGLPLPAGAVSIRAPVSGTGEERLIGQPELRDVPVGEPFELEIGSAAGVQAKVRMTAQTLRKSKGRTLERDTFEATLTNAAGRSVTGEIRQPSRGDGFKVDAETAPHTTKAGDPVWRLSVPANGAASVTYTVEWLD
jgi:hypothetical protein